MKYTNTARMYVSRATTCKICHSQCLSLSVTLKTLKLTSQTPDLCWTAADYLLPILHLCSWLFHKILLLLHTEQLLFPTFSVTCSGPSHVTYAIWSAYRTFQFDICKGQRCKESLELKENGLKNHPILHSFCWEWFSNSDVLSRRLGERQGKSMSFF